MLLKGGRAADAGVEQFAQDDFDQRQEHQGGQRERDQEVFAVPQPAAPAVACRGGLDRTGRIAAVLAVHFLPPSRAARKVFNWLDHFVEDVCRNNHPADLGIRRFDLPPPLGLDLPG